MIFPSPVAFWLGPWPIRWYGLAYAAGILLAWLYGCLCIRYKKFPGLSLLAWNGFLNWAVLGIILGGRLGDVLLYAPGYYWQHPLQIVQVWRGGMSFHGGLLGVLVIALIYCKKYRLSLARFFDCLACSTPIGLFLGRLANFVNQELYGRPTSFSWGVIFPDVDLLYRHPSQLYEATLEGLALFGLLAYVTWWQRGSFIPGRLSSLFLGGYGLARWISEYMREPEGSIWGVTLGQWYSLPLIIIGFLLYSWTLRFSPKQT